MTTMRRTTQIAQIQEQMIQHKIYLLREHRGMLDHDLAQLYGVSVKRLNEQIKRNHRRFPKDFLLQLTAQEILSLRSQIATLNERGRGRHRKNLPYAVTEQGVAMLSGVLNSPRAIDVNVAIMRTFVKLRQMLETNKNLKKKIEEMERKYDGQFKIVFDALRELLSPPPPKPKGPIGFQP